MLLNYEQVLMYNIIQDYNSNNFRNASYDLTIDHIFDMDGQENGELALLPQGMATIVFKEAINLPAHILAFAHVKTALARIGIMSINIGIIDPGYCGCLSTVIINYGKNTHKLKKGESCLRLTFHETEKVKNSKPFSQNVPKEVYIRDRQIETLKDLGDSFLNLKEVEKRIEENVSNWIMKRIVVVSTSIAALALVVNLANYYLNADDKTKENTVKTLNIKTEGVEEKLKQLEEKLKKIEQISPPKRSD